ncbi:Rad17 cell cycle checkpoint protein-domain-containing protein [Syncephalis fuscata]|nr:Rad17 cell cycle checkpoint protein-domain-containing protein [Syncephalis fuscata]
MNITINEWITPIISTNLRHHSQLLTQDVNNDYTSLTQRFSEFMMSADKYTPLALPSLASGSLPLSSTRTSETTSNAKTLLLIEDLPNLRHETTSQTFEQILLRFINGRMCGKPAIIILSDVSDKQDADEVAEHYGRVRTALAGRPSLPISITNSPQCQEIRFNPIAPTFLNKALYRIVNRERPQLIEQASALSALLQSIVSNVNGDIRAAINKLQFQIISEPTGRLSSSTIITSQQDETLSYFHALGKILYNKRKPQHDLKNTGLADGGRNKSNYKDGESMVEPERVVTAAGLDREQFMLFLHQNYALFTDDIETCSAAIARQSMADTMLGHWSTRAQMLPYATLASLRGYMWETRNRKPSSGFQPLYKPDLWSVRRAQQSYATKLAPVIVELNATTPTLRAGDSTVSGNYNLDVLPYLRQRKRTMTRNKQTGLRTYGEETYWVHPTAAKMLSEGESVSNMTMNVIIML